MATEARSLEPIRQTAQSHQVDIAVLPIDGARLLGRPLVMDAATALAAARLLGGRTLVPIHYAQRELPGVLRCPSTLDDLLRLARITPEPSVLAITTGRRTLIDP